MKRKINLILSKFLKESLRLLIILIMITIICFLLSLKPVYPIISVFLFFFFLKSMEKDQAILASLFIMGAIGIIGYGLIKVHPVLSNILLFSSVLAGIYIPPLLYGESSDDSAYDNT